MFTLFQLLSIGAWQKILEVDGGTNDGCVSMHMLAESEACMFHGRYSKISCFEIVSEAYSYFVILIFLPGGWSCMQIGVS